MTTPIEALAGSVDDVKAALAANDYLADAIGLELKVQGRQHL